MKKATIRNIATGLMLALASQPVALYASQPVAAETVTVQVPKVKVQGTSVEIEVSGEEPEHVVIYALTGQVVKQLDAEPGLTTVDLPAGYYIVRMGHTTVKIAVK